MFIWTHLKLWIHEGSLEQWQRRQEYVSNGCEEPFLVSLFLCINLYFHLFPFKHAVLSSTKIYLWLYNTVFDNITRVQEWATTPATTTQEAEVKYRILTFLFMNTFCNKNINKKYNIHSLFHCPLERFLKGIILQDWRTPLPFRIPAHVDEGRWQKIHEIINTLSTWHVEVD